MKLTRSYGCFSTPCINLLVLSFVHFWIQPHGTSTFPPSAAYCRSLRTYTVMFPERNSTSVFSMLYFIPAWSHAADNGFAHVGGLVEKIPLVLNRPHIANGWSCRNPPWHPRRLGCDGLSNSFRLWRGVVTAHTLFGIQHQRLTVVIWLRRHGHKLLTKSKVASRP